MTQTGGEQQGEGVIGTDREKTKGSGGRKMRNAGELEKS